MANNVSISYRTNQGDIHTFTMVFNASTVFGDMNGVVVARGTDINQPGFIPCLEAALDNYPYFAALQEVLECREKTDVRMEMIKDAMEKDLYRFNDDWYDLAASILDGSYDPCEPIFIAPSRRAGKKKSGYVYLIRGDTNPTTYKIGYTKDLESRSKTFGVKLPFDVEFEHVIETDDMAGLESELHQRYSEKRVNGEWFDLTPEDVTYIKSLGVQNG